MKKRIAALCCAVLLSQAACNVIDSATINQQAALNYRQNMDKARAARVIDTTSATAKRVQAVFRRLVPFADAANQTGQPFQWEMTVIRSNELNAWAMPGGKMAVYTGIVEKLNLTDAEIAAIIGHEMTHALLEHSRKEANRNVGISLGAQLGSQILAATTGINANTASQGVGLLTDLGGLKLMAQAGYNPEAAISVWNKMNRANDNNNALEKILSTHPTNNDRIELIRKELPNVMPIYQRARQR